MVKKQEKSNVGGGDSKKKYKGVRMRSWGSWVSEIRAPNQKTRIWLGSYSSPEAAARAYDAALLCLKKGSSTNLNFPSTSTSYHQHYFFHHHNNNNMEIMSPKSIQRIAAAAAATATNYPVTPPPTTTTIMSVDNDISQEVTETVSMNESWCEFESPKYLDMVNEFFFNPVINDYVVYEECDIRLWSF